MLRTYEPRTLDAAVAPSRVAISPSLQRLDHRFPHLGFTIDSGGRPYHVIQLTTDKALFDPANQIRRTAANWYESTILKSDRGESSYYLVPPDAIHRFASATAIYYSLVTYSGADRGNPASAVPLQKLLTDPPSVAVDPEFQAGSTASMLSIPLEDLVRYQPDTAYHSMASGLSLANGEIDPAHDAMEGEDGASLVNAQSSWDTAYSDVHDDEFTQDVTYGGAPPAAAQGNDEYTDGFDQPMGSYAASLDADDYEEAQGADPYYDTPGATTVAAAANPPAMLEDEDYRAEYESKPETSSGAQALDLDDYDDAMGEFEEDDASYEQSLENESDYSDDYSHLALDNPPPAPSASRAPAGRPPAPVTALPQSPAPAPVTTTPQPLTVSVKKRLIDAVAPFESGTDLYAAINRDGEFEGRFPNHPATGRYHIGLSYGIVQFTQDSGSLGKLLRDKMRPRDTAAFDQIFGGPAMAAELIRITNAAGPPSSKVQGGRSARVQPVSGEDLWRDAWVARFRQAASQRPFQAAQNELAAELYLDPMLRFARWLGLVTDRALAMVLDRAVQMGVGGARSWIIGAVGPIISDAQRTQALGAVHAADLRAFQATVPDLQADGKWGPETHAVLVSALRQLGSGVSPIPIPALPEMLRAMLRRAAATNWERRVRTLHDSPDFTDTEYAV